jgi:hypothetical protein
MGAVQSVTFTSYAVVAGTITLTANVVIKSGETADVSEFVYILYAGGTTYDPATPTSQSPASGEYTNDFTLTLTFSALDFPNLYISEQANTYTVQYPAGNQVGTASYTYYSSPPTIQFTSFTVILYQLDNTIIRANFTYNSSGFEPSTSNFIYYLNGSILDNSYITWNITDNESGGVGFADFSRVGAVTAALFLQASTQTHFIRYQDNEIGPFNTSTITTKFTVSDSNNIIIQNPVTIVTISAYKSIILPPVATKKGILYHFKILTATAPYTFRIVPYFSVSPPIPPLLTSLYSSLTFDSVIEGVAGPLTFDSTTTRNTVTLVSDGTNWWILNKYLGTLTPSSAALLPNPAATESTETTSFQYNFLNNRDSLTNIIIHPMSSSYLKYIFIINSSGGSETFSIYFPSGAGLETLSTNDGDIYKYFSFPLPSGAVGGVILTYSNSRYYIIGTSINASITSISPSIETPLTISSSISRLTTGTYFELPYVSNITSSNAVLTIIKAGTGTKQVNAATNVLFQIAQQTNSAFSLPTNSTVWFIVIKNGNNQYYLPVSYYSPA